MELDKIYQGNSVDVLKSLPDNFIQCIVTSPPYYGLRDYGVVGQIGQEETPEKYVEKLSELFNEVKRCLKDDGVLWLNLGDSYSNKNLLGIPWRIAFSLQNSGWYLRSDIIWSKPNPMPESIVDRPTRAHEYIFLFSKSERYYYNGDAIKEPAIYFEKDPRPSALERGQIYDYDSKEKEIRKTVFKNAKSFNGKHSDKQRGHSRRHAGFNDRWDLMNKNEQCSAMRNKRTVWEIPTYPYSGAHFATFPEQIPSICIKAGSREGDIIMDPFMGSGTVGLIAKRFKRKYIGIELNPRYIQIATERINSETEPLLSEI